MYFSILDPERFVSSLLLLLNDGCLYNQKNTHHVHELLWKVIQQRNEVHSK